MSAVLTNIDLAEGSLLSYRDQVRLIELDKSSGADTFGHTSRHLRRAPSGSVPKRRTFRPVRPAVETPSSLDAWHRYLDRLVDAPVRLDAAYARAVRNLWQLIVEQAGVRLQPPVAGPGGELGFQFAWQRPDVYIDIDIAPDGAFEWFFTNRTTGQSAASEDERLRVPPEALIAALVKHFHA